MKRLTYSAMAAARLRANKRQYLSLLLGVFLSVFLVSTLVLGVYGVYQAFLEKRYDTMGYMDMIILDNDEVREDALERLEVFDRMGHVWLSGEVTGTNLYLGRYDDTALALMNLTPIEGRMPEAAGELALEKTALDVMNLSLQLGDTLELAITPIDGVEELRSYTVVGFLPERSANFRFTSTVDLSQMPALVISEQEPAFSVGRLGQHWLLSLEKSVTLVQAMDACKTLYPYGSTFWNYFYGVSATSKLVRDGELGALLNANYEIFNMVLLACFLAGALILSCGVGISCAMEGLLAGRREEIGVLRALGATKRQIRRMFGRENLLLALAAAPVSIAISCAAVWGLSRLMPETLAFRFSFWLLLPIFLFSVAVILVSGYLPLRRASSLMPMSVIRDTAMLRRSKHIRYQKQFRPARLISARQLRLNPTRQWGAALLVGLMLLCSGLFVGQALNYTEQFLGDSCGFSIGGGVTYTYSHYVYRLHKGSIGSQTLAQLRRLTHVKELEVFRNLPVTLVLDQVPRYAMLDYFDKNYGMLDEAQFAQSLQYVSQEDQEFVSLQWTNQRQVYLDFLEEQNLSGQAYETHIETIVLNAGNLRLLKEYLVDGEMDVKALDAGEEVLVVAPEIWIRRYENGNTSYLSAFGENPKDLAEEGAQLAAWNDCFSAGQQLTMQQLFCTEEDGPVTRLDSQVTVGAVLAKAPEGHRSGQVLVLTTEQGLENLGLRTDGIHNVDLYLDRELTLEEEAVLEQQLTAIARRHEGFTVENWMERYRENARSQQQGILLLSAGAVLFFAVAVGMIVSSVTRQLNSEGKTIGMLRAVGADEKAILGCYSSQINAGVAGGIGIGLVLYGVLIGVMLVESWLRFGVAAQEAVLFSLVFATIWIMGGACWLACRLLLRLRVRNILRKSIIENIREL